MGCQIGKSFRDTRVILGDEFAVTCRALFAGGKSNAYKQDRLRCGQQLPSGKVFILQLVLRFKKCICIISSLQADG